MVNFVYIPQKSISLLLQNKIHLSIFIWCLQIWSSAIQQVFYSLSVGLCPIIMLSSYNRFNHTIYRWVNKSIDNLVVSKIISLNQIKKQIYHCSCVHFFHKHKYVKNEPLCFLLILINFVLFSFIMWNVMCAHILIKDLKCLSFVFIYVFFLLKRQTNRNYLFVIHENVLWKKNL